jgi:hypothetical protein
VKCNETESFNSEAERDQKRIYRGKFLKRTGEQKGKQVNLHEMENLSIKGADINE